MEKEEKQNVYKKLQKARVMLQNKNNKKSGKNKFANFSYYELGDFMPSVNEIFNEIGLFSLFNIKDDLATLTIVNTDDVIDTITFQSPIAEAEIKGSTPIQCLGGIHTYMKRYLYLNALEIVESDMFDAKVGDKDKPLIEGKKEIKNQSVTIVTPVPINYRDELVKYCSDNELDMSEIARKYKLNAKTNQDTFKAVYETLKETQDVQLDMSMGTDFMTEIKG